MELNIDRDSLLERFLRYVKIETTSDEDNQETPSSACQWDLARVLVRELELIGLESVRLDDHCYVYAELPENLPKSSPRAGLIPGVGFIAHMDVSPAVSGKNVKPIVHERYDGQVITFPGDPHIVLDPAVDKDLNDAIGCDIVTADGTTLLGADDKAGIAIIIAAMEYLKIHPEIEHGPIYVAFTPDEEIGRGVAKFDIDSFGAEVAYTLDGEGLGSVEDETFSADSLFVTIHGCNVHPGWAKGKMINAVKLAAELVELLPKNGKSPETTEGYEGYLHPDSIQGNVEQTRLKFIIRDFADNGLVELEEMIEKAARQVESNHVGSRIDIEIQPSYRNMKSMLDRRPEASHFAEEAIRAAGVEVKKQAIRGGTDGAHLSFMGIPTPNIFAGGFSFHGKKEWVPVQYMEKSVEVCLGLIRLWAKKGVKKGRINID